MLTSRSRRKGFKQLAVRLLPAAAFTLMFISSVFLWKYFSPNRNDAKLRELQQISTEAPVYPAFIHTSTQTSSRASDAGVYESYASMATYEQVKEFYDEALTKKGWTMASEENGHSADQVDGGNTLIFRKGDYSIAIEYHGRRPSDRVGDFSVSFLWRE
ncbi:MAG: hypothetical protein LC746_05810 [Acidobacteria bacterium]|nr:hypothetical protein [Acidobacteriota bacterium]